MRGKKEGFTDFKSGNTKHDFCSVHNQTTQQQITKQLIKEK